MAATDRADVPASLFILGAPRSGTSLTFRCLCAHPDAAWISNWLRYVPWLPAVSALNRIGRRDPQRRVDHWFHDDANAYVFGRSRRLTQRLFPNPVEAEPVHHHWGMGTEEGTARGADESYDPARFARGVRSLVRASGGRVFIDKRIDNNRRIDVIRQALPTARFLVVTRDGRAVASSLARVRWWSDYPLWWWHGTPTDWAAEGRPPIEAGARHWAAEVGAIEQGLADVAGADVHRVAYEDLVTDPAAVLSEVARFAGLAPHPVMAEVAARLPQADRATAWRESLGPDDVATIEAAVGDELRRLGYA